MKFRTTALTLCLTCSSTLAMAQPAPGSTPPPAVTAPAARPAPVSAPAPKTVTVAVPTPSATPASAPSQPAAPVATSPVAAPPAEKPQPKLVLEETPEPAAAAAPVVSPPAAAPMQTTASPQPITTTPLPATDRGAEGNRFEDDAEPIGPRRFNLAGHVDSLWHTAKSYDLFSSNDILTTFGASIGYAVLMDGPWSVVPELGFSIGSAASDGNPSSVFRSSELTSNRFYGGVQARYLLLPFLEPYARLAGGAERNEATLTQVTGETLNGSATSPFASLGAGFSVHSVLPKTLSRTSRFPAFMFGVNVEGGYTVARSMSLALTPDGSSPRIPTQDTSLGSLDRSGPYVRVGLDVRL